MDLEGQGHQGDRRHKGRERILKGEATMTAAQNPSPNRGLCIDSPRSRYHTLGGRTGHNAGVESATDGHLP